MTVIEKPLDLTEMLSLDLIQCGLNLKDRNEVIEKMGKMMLETGKIESRYISAMKRVIEEFGPYVVIAPGIALLHARAQDGVLEPCIALITLSTPVIFGHPQNDPVDIVFGLAAKDDQGHIKAIATLAKRLAAFNVINNLRNASSEVQLFKEICGQ